uniref:Isochorismatase domain-containing protein 1 n=1 Tax=Pavo cristatus TaxID=9049 RepID=A0A8C9FFF9_PAVCR
FLFQMTTLGNLTPSSTVFFCCDMQERFRPAIKYFGDIISVGQRLVCARLLGIPVIVTEQYPKGLGSTVQEIDLTGAKLVLPKTKFSMVLPEVEAALAEIPGVRSVVLFGVETHVCIQQTALELIGRGLEVHIVADATSSRRFLPLGLVLLALQQNRSTAELLFLLFQTLFVLLLKILEMQWSISVSVQNSFLSVPPSLLLHQCKLKVNLKTVIIVKTFFPPPRSLVKDLVV